MDKKRKIYDYYNLPIVKLVLRKGNKNEKYKQKTNSCNYYNKYFVNWIWVYKWFLYKSIDRKK